MHHITQILQRDLRSEIEFGIRRLTKHIQFRGLRITEGSAGLEQLHQLAELVRKKQIRIVGEVGFNAGFSSYAFLTAHPDVTVVSFDDYAHPYARHAKELIDKLFPGRHLLIKGDSRAMVPRFAESCGGIRFDLVFIDGGHAYNIARTDLLNMRGLTHTGTVLVMDDLIPFVRWGIGPTLAWCEARLRGIVQEEERHTDRSNPILGVWATGHYVT